MVRLIPINYGNRNYPNGIVPRIKEIPAHFDSKIVPLNLEYSLHTEYSYGPRAFKCPACEGLSGIKATGSKAVPRLWFNNSWVRDFIQFIVKFVGNKKPPRIIEIHPPFSDYCKDLSRFIELYNHFEDEIQLRYRETEILIENRYGSRYSGGSFILSTADNLKELVDLIKEHNLRLRIALDFPQLFSAHHFAIGRFRKRGIEDLLEQLYTVREYIKSIHLWGKCLGKNNRVCSHMGTLDSYFEGMQCKDIAVDDTIKIHSYSGADSPTDDKSIKRHFLRELHDLLDDGSVRYFLPEVNSKSEHLHSLVRDLLESGFTFV